MATYYKQHQRAKKSQLMLPLQQKPLSGSEAKKPFRPHSGIPDFELKTPNNPCIVQDELFRFTGPRDDESIGFDCRGINDRQPFLVKLWSQMDRANDRAVGFNNFRSFPHGKLDFANPDSEWVRSAHARNQSYRAKHGKGLRKPHGIDWQEDCDPETPYFPEIGSPRHEIPFYRRRLTFIDRLALGDTLAGHLLFLIEQEFGYVPL